MKASFRPSCLCALFLSLLLPVLGHAEEASGYCFEITTNASVPQATLELNRDQAVIIRGELGAADKKITAISDGSLAEGSSILIMEIEVGANVIKVAFPIQDEEWKKKLAVLDLKLPHWGQLGDLNEPGSFTVGLPVGIMVEGNNLTFFPENSDPLVAPLN